MTDFNFAGLDDDPEVRAAIRRLAIDAIEQARELLIDASPNIKMQMIRQLLPALAKSLSAGKDEDEATKEALATVTELYENMQEEWGG